MRIADVAAGHRSAARRSGLIGYRDDEGNYTDFVAQQPGGRYSQQRRRGRRALLLAAGDGEETSDDRRLRPARASACATSQASTTCSPGRRVRRIGSAAATATTNSITILRLTDRHDTRARRSSSAVPKKGRCFRRDGTSWCSISTVKIYRFPIVQIADPQSHTTAAEYQRPVRGAAPRLRSAGAVDTMLNALHDVA